MPGLSLAAWGHAAEMSSPASAEKINLMKAQKILSAGEDNCIIQYILCLCSNNVLYSSYFAFKIERGTFAC
jgi:hypothetical protein